MRGRLALATGEWKVAAEQVDRSMPRWGELPMQTPFERGRYLASIVCSECHGSDYRGDPLEGGPSLAVVAPGIAEALFATAMGLLAAIPASVALIREGFITQPNAVKGLTQVGPHLARIGIRPQGGR